MEKNPAEKNMSISLILANICFQGGNTDITGKKELLFESTINNLIILYK